MSPSGSTLKGTGVAQQCIFIDDTNVKTLCLGRIGSSQRFCVADKRPFYSHCGIPAHGKGAAGSKKFKAAVGTFYVPGGASTRRPTAKMEPFIHHENIPGELLSIFKKGRKTATEWESLITQAILSKSTFEDEEEERRPRDEDTENDDGVDEDFGETSTIRSGAGDGGGDDIEINFEWDYDEDEGRDWFTMAQVHRRSNRATGRCR